MEFKRSPMFLHYQKTWAFFPALSVASIIASAYGLCMHLKWNKWRGEWRICICDKKTREPTFILDRSGQLVASTSAYLHSISSASVKRSHPFTLFIIIRKYAVQQQWIHNKRGTSSWPVEEWRGNNIIKPIGDRIKINQRKMWIK